ncbi:unnamed protein product [Heterobilharzia americana]|nr:unnamed protein product [Heterobilharzia americana]
MHKKNTIVYSHTIMNNNNNNIILNEYNTTEMNKVTQKDTSNISQQYPSYNLNNINQYSTDSNYLKCSMNNSFNQYNKINMKYEQPYQSIKYNLFNNSILSMNHSKYIDLKENNIQPDSTVMTTLVNNNNNDDENVLFREERKKKKSKSK